jgi:hypothetical protein
MGDNSTDSEEGSDNPLPTTPRQDEEEIKYLIDYDQVLVRIITVVSVVFDTF